MVEVGAIRELGDKGDAMSGRKAIPEHAVKVELEVPFHDIDALHIVWHGHYYKYFEVARTALMRRYNLDGVTLLRTGYRLVVIESKCRHAASLHYGERFLVRAYFKDIDHRINVAFEIESLDTGKRVARGHTILATLDEHGQLLLETPSTLRERLPSGV